MKLLILQITLCLFVASIKATNHGLLDNILKEFHIDTPEGHQLLELDACYNKKVGNTTFDIFKDNIHPIITHFFNTQATLNSRLDVTNFVSNLHILADNIISCVTNPIFTERSKLGITSMFIYSMSDYLNKILNNYGASEYSLKNLIIPNPKTQTQNKPYPKNFSWQDEGYVTPVRNQGSCGSCYVEQAILNCMRPPYASSSGCDGGIIPDPIDRMINVGVSLTKDAPYIEKLNQCQTYPIFMKADDKCTYEDLNNDQIKRLVYRNGPAAVVLNAVQFKI
ncbi:hypothetical protein BLOT_016818 [Blomia tropicalis]|nr:hypothetical protein BLOT_016818 [Blomia tropicalis]